MATGILDDTVQQLGGIGKQFGTQTLQMPKSFVKSAANQIVPGIVSEENKEKLRQKVEKSGNGTAVTQKKDEETKKLVESLYAPSAQQEQPNQQQLQQASSTMQDKTPEEQAKIAETQQKLEALKAQHTQSYYIPTFVEKPKQREQEDQQKDMQKKEEKQMKDLEMQDKKKKDDDIALKMATNKAEQFRGAAG